MVRRLTPTSSQAFMIEMVLRSTASCLREHLSAATPTGISLVTKPSDVNDLTPRIVEPGDGRAPHRQRRLLSAAADVWCPKEIWQCEQLTIDGRLSRVHIER